MVLSTEPMDPRMVALSILSTRLGTLSVVVTRPRDSETAVLSILWRGLIDSVGSVDEVEGF